MQSSFLIPPVCHYDEFTLLTKQGDLIQILKIEGCLTTEDSCPVEVAIRNTMMQHLVHADIAIHIHVMKEKHNLKIKSEFHNQYAKEIFQQWLEYNEFDKYQSNVIFLTIVQRGKRFALFSQNIFAILTMGRLKKVFLENLATMHAKLNDLTSSIVANLQNYSARKLTMLEEISEPISFFNRLCNLNDKKIAIRDIDVSLMLARYKMLYNYNQIEFYSFDNDDKVSTYCAIFSCKYLPPNVSKTIIDEVLRLNCEIAESFYLYNDKAFTATLNKARSYQDASQSSNLFQEQEISNAPIVAQQIIITIHGNNKNIFEQDVENLIRTAKKHGIILVREDFAMSSCFWSRLPGNENYIARQRFIPVSHIGQFTSVVPNNTGFYHGSKICEPITILKNINYTPYYFNFHDNLNGNTIVIGKKDSGKTTLINFLVSQSTEISNARYLYIDFYGNSSQFVKKMNGREIFVSSADSALPDVKFLSVNLSQYNGDKIDYVLSILENIEHHVHLLVIILKNASQIYRAYNEKITNIVANLSKKNAMIIMSFASKKEEDEPDKIKSFLKTFSVQIYLVDKFINKAFKTTYDLTEHEAYQLKMYDTKRRAVLIKHKNDSVMTFVPLYNIIPLQEDCID